MLMSRAKSTDLLEISNRLSWYLANLDDLEVVKLLSRVIMDLADGEVKQGLFRYDTGQSFETYLEKSYCKTASLIANSARAAGVLSGLPAHQLDELYRFGRQLGLAFQVVDDILDEGITLAAVKAALLKEGAKSIRIAVLVTKSHDRNVSGLEADYVGIEVPDRYVFGCGMDYQEYFRQFPAIYALAED